MGYVFPPQSYTAWEVGLTIVHLLAISATVFRLYHRIREKRMWLDDYVIVVALVADCFGFGIQWERMWNRFPTPCKLIESFWIMMVFFMTVLWLSRMSLAFSIARMFPRRAEKKFGIGLGILYVGCCMASLGITAITCHPKDHRPWYMMDASSCIRSGNGHIISGLSLLTIEIGADIILIGYPLFVLWKVTLPKRQRRVIMAALSGSILTILATVVLAVFWYNTWNLGPDYWLISTGVANIDGAIGLLVCNLLFITMFFYRYLHRNEDSEESTRAPTSGTTNGVTGDRPERRITTIPSPESSLNVSFTDIILQSSLYPSSPSFNPNASRPSPPLASRASDRRKQKFGDAGDSNTRLTSS